MPKKLILIALICVAQQSMAQHCGYDHTALIGIRPVNANNQIIDGLRITLIDEANKPIIVSKSIYKHDQYISSYKDTAEFWRNPLPNKQGKHNFSDEEKRHFVHASTDYIILTGNKGREEKGRYAKIEDIDGSANGGHFNSKIVYIKPSQVQALCGYPDLIGPYQPHILQLDFYKDANSVLRITENDYRFELDHAPLFPCPECVGCVCKTITVFNPKDSIIYHKALIGNEQDSRIGVIYGMEVGDYNFDGIPDFKLLNDPLKQNQFYLYDARVQSFVLEPKLSEMSLLTFDFNNKIATGIVFDTKSHVNPNKIQSGSKYSNQYQFSGKNLEELRIVSKLDLPEGSQNTSDTAFYSYINHKMERKANMQMSSNVPKIIINNQNTTLTKIVGSFKFVLEKNYPEVVLPAQKGYYANKISVYSLAYNQLIFSTVVVGNSLKEAAGCRDSLQIADYNFDEFPDFRVCNNSVPGKHTYYIFHKKRYTFTTEKTLSELNSLTFDFENKVAKGSSDRKEHYGYPSNSPYQYYMEHLQFEGKDLENLMVTTTTYGSGTQTTYQGKYINQKRIYNGDSLAIKMLKNNFLTKTVGPYKFEVEFNPEDYKPSDEKGSYVKVLKILKGERLVGQFEMHGNYLKEVPHWLDSMEIADFNSDGYPDIRMYKSNTANGKYVYLLYNSDNGSQVFYEDTYFSEMVETEFYPNQKILKGKIIEPNQTIYLFLKNDTLTVTKRENDLSKPPYFEESIYRNGTKQILRTAYNSLEPILKKEYADYNFDGEEDFRQQRKTNPHLWDVFIYQPSQQTYVKDTLLSKFEYFEYSKEQKRLEGYFQVRIDETTREYYYYRWSFEDNQMVLYQTKVCYSESPYSESYECVISQRQKDGTWIDTEILRVE